jgi:hypothetical protein
MRRDQAFKFQRALDAFEKAKGRFHDDDNAVKAAIDVWESGRDRSNDDIAITGHVVANGRWFVVLVVLCWLSLAFITRDTGAVAVAAVTSLAIGAAWITDQARGFVRYLAMSFCVGLPVASFGVLLWAVR